MNAMEWNRDLTRPVGEINEREKELTDKPDRGNARYPCRITKRKYRIGSCYANCTLCCTGKSLPGGIRQRQAWAQTQGQFAWYKAMEDAGEMIQVNDLASLEKHIALWNDENDKEKNLLVIF